VCWRLSVRRQLVQRYRIRDDIIQFVKRLRSLYYLSITYIDAQLLYSVFGHLLQTMHNNRQLMVTEIRWIDYCDDTQLHNRSDDMVAIALCDPRAHAHKILYNKLPQTRARGRSRMIDVCGRTRTAAAAAVADELARIGVARQQIDGGRVAYYFIMFEITRIIIFSYTRN